MPFLIVALMLLSSARSGNPHDEQLLLSLSSPYIEAGEIANLLAAPPASS